MDIELREASRQFIRRGEKFFAIENVDLQIKQGEFLFLTGSSKGLRSVSFFLAAMNMK